MTAAPVFETIKYLRFSLLVAVPAEIEPEVVENDIRDFLQGSFLFVEDEAALPNYNMLVTDIEFKGDETL